MSETKSAPQTPVAKGHVVINVEECKGCELCVAACPAKVLFLTNRFNTHGYHPSAYKGEGCTGCGICFYNCPELGAITVFKRWDLVTETALCPHCDGEHKVFPKENSPGVLICTNCLGLIGTPDSIEKVITIK
ncbi:MAG: ferredoxin family protein [Candidatus Neomarinimicrobiota bacterium]